jgi:L-aspartate oxidase
MFTSFPTTLPSLTDSAPYIVLGSGVAGLYTALELSRNHPVILLTKASLSESNTYYAQGGIASALGTHDSPELHYQDTMMAGAGLCNSKAVLTLVYDGPERVRHLIDLGTPFDRKNGEISFTREAAHSRPRILHADGDATGREISLTLIEKVRRSNIRVYENHFALGLVTEKGHCHGVVTLNAGELHLFLSSAVILCTGGIGQIYGKTTNPEIATGDGMALAYNAGAVLRDVEFLQFHPTALHLPPAPPFLISETVRGEGAILLNSAGERFMPDYHPLAELAPRDVVARAIFAESKRSSVSSSSVYLDLSKIPTATIKNRFPNIFETCLRFGLDITASPIPVAPAAHYMMGGVVTDLCGRTGVPRLYAAGEVASTGVHGANRLASNSLLEGLVFGGRAAGDMQKIPIRLPDPASNYLKIHYPRVFTDYSNLQSDYVRLRQITDQHLGIVRDALGLNEAMKSLELAESGPGGFELDPQYFELQNLFHLAVLMAKAALYRTESRGGHYRADFPEPVDEWRKHIIFHHSKMEVMK